MMRVSIFTSLLALLALTTNVSATNYYLSASTGNDNNSGTSSSQPWQTINKLNQYDRTLRSGDVVYFCQGDQWLYSSISSRSHGVTFDSYQCRSGQTAKPVISAAIQPAGNAWSRVGTSNILTATLDTVARANGVQAIWVNNVRYVTARHPNLRNPTNTLTIGQTTWGLDGEFLTTSRLDGTTIYSNDLTQGTDYWNGATCTVRVLNYAYLPYTVIASGPGFITLHHPPGKAAGFYLSHTPDISSSNTHLQVNNPGEFSFDTQTGQMFLYPLTTSIASNILSGSQPVSILYNGASAAILVQGGIMDITIRNLHFKWAPIGISTQSNQALMITQNQVSHIAGHGIYSARSGPITVVNNNVFDVESTCIIVQTTTRISSNTVRQCGLYAGLGAWQATNGINCAGGECSYNSVSLVGYIGIAPTSRAFVLANTIDYSLLALNDGGAIYGYGAGMSGVSLYSNVVTNVVGNWVSWYAWPIAPCFYLDATTYIQIYNNTCTAAPSCVQMNKGNGHLVFSNVCNAPGMYINQATATSTFMGNLIATTGTNTNLQNSLHRVQAPDRARYADIMTTADNIYCIPQGANANYLFQMVKDGLNTRYYSFDDWKNSVVPSMPAWERGTNVYTSCRGMRATFTGNEVSSLPMDLSAPTSSDLAVKVAVPVVLISVVLIAVLIGMVVRSTKAKSSSTLPTTETVEIELPEPSPPTPTSASVSSFTLMTSPRSSSIIQV